MDHKVKGVLVTRDPLQFGCRDEFTNSFRGRLSLECEMRSILVVFCFPPLQFSSQIFLVPKVLPSVKLGCKNTPPVRDVY